MQKILSMIFLSLPFTVAFSTSSWADEHVTLLVNAPRTGKHIDRELVMTLVHEIIKFEKKTGKDSKALRRALTSVLNIYSDAIDKSIEETMFNADSLRLTGIVQQGIIDLVEGKNVKLDTGENPRFQLVQDLFHDLGERVKSIQEKALAGQAVDQPIDDLRKQIEQKQLNFKKKFGHTLDNDLTLAEIRNIQLISENPKPAPLYKPWVTLNELPDDYGYPAYVRRNSIVRHNPDNTQLMNKGSDQPNVRIPRQSQFLRKAAGRVGIAAGLLATGVVAERYLFSSEKRKPVQEKTYGKRRSTAESSAGGGTSSVASGD